jgi:hypothetical protein
MSGLVLKGNTINTTGEYLPAPYIDKISIYEDGDDTDNNGYKIEVSIFMPDGDKDVQLSPNIAGDETLLALDLMMNLHYYVVVFKGYDSDNNPVDKIGGGEESLIDYWISIDGGAEEDKAGFAEVYKVYPNFVSPTIEYDEEGNLFYKVTAEVSNVDNPFYWSHVDNLAVFAFSSTLEFSTEARESPLLDLDISSDLLLETQISDVAYENVFENNAIANRYQIEYMDANDAVYDQTPLQSLNSAYYKVDTMTHEDIVEYFQELHDEFTAEYDLDSYPKLQTMLNNLSLVLTTYGEKVDLVPQLNALRQVTPDKAPTAPIGKLYKRFRDRIYTVDKAIRNSEKLRRVVLFNGKILDFRPPPVGSKDPSYQDLLASEILYTDWATRRYALKDWTGASSFESTVVNGAFLFDYEKALRRNSIISNYLNVDKLEAAGVHIPYDSFRVIEAGVARGTNLALVEGSITDELPESFIKDDMVDYCTIVSHMDENKDYPLTKEITGVTYTGASSFSYLEPAPKAGGDHWKQIVECGEIEGSSYLTVRSYVNPIDEEKTPISSNYRLLLFELQDFFTDWAYSILTADTPEDDDFTQYATYVTVKDNTGALLETILTEVEAHQAALEEYHSACEELCAMNEDTDTFNSFFADAMLDQYGDDMEEAPWIKVPVAWAFFDDLLSNIHGGDPGAIANAAAEIIQQINPVNGTLEAIEKFREQWVVFIETFLNISTLEEQVTEGATLTYNGNLEITAAWSAEDHSFDADCAGLFDVAEEEEEEVEEVDPAMWDLLGTIREDVGGNYNSWDSNNIWSFFRSDFNWRHCEDYVGASGLTKWCDPGYTTDGEIVKEQIDRDTDAQQHSIDHGIEMMFEYAKDSGGEKQEPWEARVGMVYYVQRYDYDLEYYVDEKYTFHWSTSSTGVLEISKYVWVLTEDVVTGIGTYATPIPSTGAPELDDCADKLDGCSIVDLGAEYL